MCVWSKLGVKSVSQLKLSILRFFVFVRVADARVCEVKSVGRLSPDKPKLSQPESATQLSSQVYSLLRIRRTFLRTSFFGPNCLKNGPMPPDSRKKRRNFPKLMHWTLKTSVLIHFVQMDSLTVAFWPWWVKTLYFYKRSWNYSFFVKLLWRL